MAGYVRQSTADIIPTATVRAAPINAEYNALRDAFAASGGHKHDGTTGEGEYVPLIADLDALNKVVIDTTNNRVGVFVEVSAAAVEQIRIQDGVIVPVTDNDIDLGTSSLEFKDLYLDGTAYIDTLAVHESATITSNFSVNGNTTLGNAASDTVTFTADIASAMLPSADDTHDLGAVGSEWRNLYIDGTANIDALIADTATISAGTIDNTVIGGSTAVAGSFSTISSSGATTLASLTVSGATALNGGLTLDTNKFTVADTTGNTAIAGTLDVTGATTVADFTATGTTVLPATSFGDNNITNVGNIALDSITADGSSITITGNTTFADGAYDFDVASHDGSNGLKLAGTLVTSSAAELNKLDGATVTTTEINILDGDNSATSTTVADADRVVMNDNGTMVQVAVTDLAAYFDDEITAMPNLVTTAATTVGALNSGSITSGFGSIDTGSSTITTTGNITGGNVIISDGGNIGSASDTDAIAIASNGNVTLSQNLTVSGDLQVDGTTTTVNSNNLSVDDQLIELGNGRTGSATGDSGIVIERGSDANAFIGFDESADKFTVGTGTFTGTSTGDLSITTGTLVANIEGNVTGDLTGNADTATALETARTIAGQSFDGTANISIATTDLTGVTATAAEVNIMDGDTAATSTTLADADRVVVNDAGTMKQVALTDFETYFESALDTLSNVTTVGTLNSGSITSGFGSIDNGSSAITTTGTITFGTLSDGSDSVTDIVTSVGSGSANSELPTALAVENRIQAINSISNNVSGLNATGAELNAVADVSAITIDTSTAIANNDGIAVFDSSASAIGYFDVDLLDTYFAGTTKTLTNKTLTSPTVSGLYLSDAGFIVEGSSADGNEATVTFTNPTADRTITFPDATGTVALSGATQNVDFGTVTADGLAVDTDTLYVDSTNDRVGVGTSSPDTTLEVSTSGSGVTDVLKLTTTSANSVPAILFEADAGSIQHDAARFRVGQTDQNNSSMIFEVQGSGSLEEAMRIDSSQRVLIGHGSSQNIATSSGAGLQISSTGALAAASISRFKDADSGPWLFFGKSRGATVGTNAVVSSGDSLGALRFGGDDGTDIQSYGAEIKVNVDGTPGSNDMPGRLSFWTTANGSAATTERMRITNDGMVTINHGGTGSQKTLIIKGTGTGTNPAATAQTGAAIQLTNLYATDDAFNIIDFHNSNNLVTSRIAGINTNIASRHGDIAFLTHSGAALAEAMRIDSSGRVLIGTTSTRTVDGYNQHMLLEGAGITKSSFAMVNHSNDVNGAYFYLSKARGTTIGGSTIVQDGDVSGAVVFTAADGTDMASKTAQIQANVDGSPGANDMPGRLQFYTTADGASSVTERMRINNAGTVIINPNLTGGYTPLKVKGERSSSTTLLSLETDGTGQDDDTINLDFKMNSGADATERVAGRIGVQNSTTGAARGRLIFSVLEDAGNLIEAMRIDDDGEVLIGSTSATNSVTPLNLKGAAGGVAGNNFVAGKHGDSNFQPAYTTVRSRGSEVSPTSVADDDGIAAYNSYGYDGNSYIYTGGIQMFVDGTPGTNDMPSRLSLYTTSDGAASATERVRITKDGNIGIGGVDPVNSANYKTIDVRSTNGGQIILGRGSNQDFFIYSALAGNTIGSGTSSGYLRFMTNSSGSSNEAMRIDSSQRLLIGKTSTTAVGSSASAKLQISQNKTILNTVFDAYGDNAGGSTIAFGSSRSATVGTPGTIVQDNDNIGAIRFAADDGTDLQTQAALIIADVDGTPGSNDMPGRLEFHTTADGSSSPTERMRITNAGNVIIDKSGENSTVVTTGAALEVHDGHLVHSRQGSSNGSRTFVKFFQFNNAGGTAPTSATLTLSGIQAEFYCKITLVGVCPYSGNSSFTYINESVGYSGATGFTVISANRYGAGTGLTFGTATLTSGTISIPVTSSQTSYRFIATAEIISINEQNDPTFAYS